MGLVFWAASCEFNYMDVQQDYKRDEKGTLSGSTLTILFPAFNFTTICNNV